MRSHVVGSLAHALRCVCASRHVLFLLETETLSNWFRFASCTQTWLNCFFFGGFLGGLHGVLDTERGPERPSRRARARVKGSKLNLFTCDLKTNLRSQRVWPWTTSHQLNGTKPIIISQFTATCPQEYLADTLTNRTWLYSHYGKKLRRPGREPKPLTTFLAALASHTLPCQHPFVWRHCWSMKTS